MPAYSPRAFRHFFTFSVVVLLSASSSFGTEKPVILERQDLAQVWAGHPVGFAFITAGDIQYAAYYDAERNMTVASRKLGEEKWKRIVLPSQVQWDSHNYIAMQVDSIGMLHVSGNMHASPLIYFRTKAAGDINTLEPVKNMTGEREDHVTYPQFLKGNSGELIFTYRDGGSGNGTTIYNRYDEKTGKWSRLTDEPLLDGLGDVNAYPVGPTKGPDGYWHLTWVWRDTPDASTNHDLSYARSKDLAHWETIEGKALVLPITPRSEGVVVDPVPANGGIINGSGKIGFDDQKRVVIAYHKFDEAGATQLYLTRFEVGAWKPRVLTEWTYRWEPKGNGTISFDVYHSALEHDPEAGYYISYSNAKHGKGVWKVDPASLTQGEKLPDSAIPGTLPGEIYQPSAPGMKVSILRDGTKRPDGTEYVLRWETLPYNRDRPTDPAPAPSTLEWIKVGQK